MSEKNLDFSDLSEITENKTNKPISIKKDTVSDKTIIVKDSSK